MMLQTAGTNVSVEERMQNPIIESLMNHRSIRKFKDRGLEQETLEMVVKAGIRGATGGNLQI